MPKGVPNKRYTPEFKKLVIETMQEEKLSYSETCRRFEVNSRDRIKSWERIYLEEGPEGFAVERRGRSSKGRPPKQLPKQVEEDLLAEVQRLRAENDMKQNAGVSNIEITEGNIKAFESTAKKYGIDFALKKDATESPPRYLVFFKGRDADVLTAAFKEFSAKKLTQEKKPSIRKLLSTLKEAAQGRNAERAKVKNKDREVSL